MIVEFDFLSGKIEVAEATDRSRLHVSVYGEALLFAEVSAAGVEIGIAFADEEPTVVHLVPVAARRWRVEMTPTTS